MLASVGVVDRLVPTRPATPYVLRATPVPSSAVPTASASSGPYPGGALPGPGGDDEERKRQQEFRLNVGKVIDTLQADYPLFFEQAPDLSIYEPNIELTDPSGLSLRGLSIYSKCFSLLRWMRHTMASVEVKCKVCYSGWDPRLVRTRWNVAFSTFVNPSRTYFIDGISEYTLSDKGLVRRHALKNVIVNGREVRQPYLQLISPVGIGRPVQGMIGGPLGQALVMPVPHVLEASEAEATKQPADGKRAPPPASKGVGSNIEFCETSYDCDYPLFCCDLLFAKVCCRNGAFAPATRPVPVPIPIPVEPPGPYNGW